MGKQILRLTLRGIRSFLGRYIALFLIVALSVGFFAGLKVTGDAMTATGDDFLTAHAFYDYRIFSTLGFTEEDESAFADISYIGAAEGGKSADALLTTSSGDAAFHLLSLPERVNLPSLKAGALPSKAGECLGDARFFGEGDIGKTVTLAKGQTGEAAGLTVSSFVLTGTADSPLYLGNDRGVTDIGSGSLRGFLYLPPESFTGEVYTEMNLLIAGRDEIYRDEKAYDDLVEEHRDALEHYAKDRASKRREDLLSSFDRLPVGTGPADRASGNALRFPFELSSECLTGVPSDGVPALSSDLAGGALPDGIPSQPAIPEPEVYLLTREENTGYVSFTDDSAIVSGIADILPVFFILIAILVCMTTVSRMVDEERTQIGVLKALGMSGGGVTAKYLLYAGSAAVLGWVVGFFAGTWGLPQIFWYAYSPLYGFSELRYLFSPVLALLTLAAALAGILGSCFFSCRKEMRDVPAALIRPRTAKAGKRVLIERLPFVWKRLRFLQKITLRNMFRYKQRFIMMLVGIGCCAAMVVTSFGLRDSMLHIADLHYGEVQTYDLEVTVSDEDRERVTENGNVEAALPCTVHRVEVRKEDTSSTVNLYSFGEGDGTDYTKFWNLRRHGDRTALQLPGEGGALLSMGSAKALRVSEGETVTVRTAEGETASFTVEGIFEGYIDNFLMLSSRGYEKAFGERRENALLIKAGCDPEALGEQLLSIDGVTGVKQLSAMRERVDKALFSINIISIVVLLFAGALAFTVIYNLTNINIAERSREIATVEVLGFYKEETESYVLRENLALSLLASLIGLPLGKLLHAVVMGKISITSVAFDLRISLRGYLLSFVCTLLFAAVVNLCMRRRISKIKMAESLKAVE